MTTKQPVVLLIEDDKSLIEMYQVRFQEDGFTILLAEDGATGLELARTKHPDIILLDIMLPKMDGFAVLIELKKDNATKKIPVLMMTNLGQQADIDKGKQLGADDYIVKSSLTPSQVSEKIKAFLK
ncbi:MAG: hypothetical protein A3J59_04250 [Candidatus Buchananbacteria bacterium RIFCSPHIGHO2_02_FULL_56_16]|uniref:Response regulatory domain-containing protein n=1 Tax=Candidatus Buchananbacteria bacterium RIFCSPHIGHO2_02_FULL_56_16 TaxID=1797542 RepID=A0A1G1YJR2_9BACT|nr:MAG: hypothetical protein A3J59_04250 [Candidatus Buchananbacteria bacterium RIFCSPHIGHO2_02_FULL_56_16]